VKVKALVDEERITLPELREELLRLEKERISDGIEMTYELRKSIEHANRLSRISAAESRELVSKLLTLDKMKEDIAYRIVNLMPRTRDELRAIYAKERFTLTTGELDGILDLVRAYC